MLKEEEIKLTAFGYDAGFGCRISPEVLNHILYSDRKTNADPSLISGLEPGDDSAVYDMGNGQALISVSDFFMPMVNDAYDFGRIAATNAISSIYAMGGKPLVAVSTLGWPVSELPADMARTILEGGREVCSNAGISLSAGSSIESQEPFFGLSVNGVVNLKTIKRNNTARPGCFLYLTKKLGTGILSVARQKGILHSAQEQEARQIMLTLNKIGEKAGELDYVRAMATVDGFGLLGHLISLCERSELQAVISMQDLPLIESLDTYINADCVSACAAKNFESYHKKISPLSDRSIAILADPQISGGLLIAVEKEFSQEFELFLQMNGINDSTPFGFLQEKNGGPTIECHEL